MLRLLLTRVARRERRSPLQLGQNICIWRAEGIEATGTAQRQSAYEDETVGQIPITETKSYTNFKLVAEMLCVGFHE